MRIISGALVFLLGLLGLATLACADTVIFKNGDKLSGTFVEVQDKKLSFKSDAVGDVSIPLEKIQSLSVEKPAVILGMDRRVVRGQIELQATGDWQVTLNGTSQTIGAASVSVILPAETYHAQVEEPVQLWQDWSGSINFGYAIQRGDQSTSTLNASVIATRERPHDLLFVRHWRTNYSLNTLLAKAQQGGESVTSNTITTALRQDYLFTSRDFIFVTGQLDHIDAQGLYLRQTYGGGIGRDLIHNTRTLFGVVAGADYIHESFFVGPSNASVEAAIGEKLGVQISSRLRLDQALDFFPDLEHASRYHGDASATLGLKISRRFSANAGAIDQYISRPSPGSKNNNITLTTGLGINF